LNMKKISESPERYTTQIKRYLARCEKNNEEPNQAYIDMYENSRRGSREQVNDPKWQKDNLEYDLRSTDWILEKVRTNEGYAQNLYAALCNRQFRKKDMWNILKDQRWSCTWRYAGGIIADMQEKGDYMDWYCSGRSTADYDSYDETYGRMPNNVPEGYVTSEVEQDLDRLGWLVLPEEEDDRL
jgi:hypothetical protein